MLVTDDRLLAGRDVLELARAAERGRRHVGAAPTQDGSAREQVALARALVEELDVPVLVNDRPDIAHRRRGRGRASRPGRSAGGARPPDRTAGVRDRGVGRLGRGGGRAAGRADYWGIGPWRVTTTKADAGEGLGPEGFARLVRLAAGRPCIAIGAVQPEDAGPVRAAGGSGLAVVSGILGSEDVGSAAARYAAEVARQWGVSQR